MKRPRTSIRYLSAILPLVLAIAPVAWAQVDEPEEHDVKKIHREVIIHCEEGEDCSAGDHHMVWIGDGSHGDHFSLHSSLMGRGGYLGVQLTALTPELRSHFGVPDDTGVMVGKVLDDTAAFRAGLAVGDIITRVDGEPVASPRDLAMAIRELGEGDSVNLEVWRNGAIESIVATVDKHESFGPGHHAVIVKCAGESEDCNCTVNGEAVDCESLHHMHSEED